MSWVAVDNTYGDNNECGGGEYIYMIKPEKWNCLNWRSCGYKRIPLPKGSIKKLIGRELNWYSEPVEIK